MSAPSSARARAPRAATRTVSRTVPRRIRRCADTLLTALGVALGLAAVPTPSAALVGAEGAPPARTTGPAARALMPDVWIYPYDGSTVNSSSITASVDACDYYGGGVSYIDLYVNGSYYGTEWNYYGGCLSMSRTVSLGSGWNTITANACGWDCNTATSYVYYEYVPPPPPPGPSVWLYPGHGSYVYGTPLSFSADACDYSWGVYAIYLYVNGSYVGYNDGGGWGCGSAWASGNLSPGWNTISVYACNGYGSCTWADASIYFVPPAPTLSFSPGNGAYVYSNPYVVSTSACSPWDASYVHLYVNGGHVATGYGGGWGCASTSAWASLAAGWNTISAYTCNAWGSCSSASVSIYYMPPPPDIAFDPGNGAYVYSSPYGVSNWACSPWDVALIYTYVNGTHVNTGYGGGWGCASTWSSAYLSPGWNTISSYACNTHWNCQWASASIYFVAPPPAVSFYPANGSTVYGTPQYLQADACSSWGDVSVVYLYVNGGHVGTAYGGGWGCATAAANAWLAGGWNTVSTYACNPYNCGWSSVSIYFVPPAPALSFSPGDGAYVYSSPYAVSTSACSSWDAAYVHLYVNGGHVATGYGGNGTGCASTSAWGYLAAGWNTVSAYTCNAWGSCASAAVYIYYVPPAPSISFSPGNGSTVYGSPYTLASEACSPWGVSVLYLYVNGTHVNTGYGGWGCASTSAYASLSPGWNTVSGYACNQYGGCGWNSASVYFAPPAPAVSFYPANGATVYSSPHYTQADACTSWGDVSVVYLYVNGGHIGTGYGGGWGCATAAANASLAGGWNTLSAYACNPYTCGWSSVSIYFVPPAPAISFSHANWSYVYENPSTVSTSACSPWDASYVHLYVNSGHVNTGYGGNGTGCATTSASASLAAGWNTVSAYTCNAWGSCASAAIYVYYMPPPPAVSFSPGNGATVYSSPSGVSAEACSPWDVAYVSLYVNGSHVNTGYGGGWGCATSSATASLSPGWNTVSAYACNSHYNCGWSSASVYFQPPGPAITMYPAHGATVWDHPSYLEAYACTSWGDVSVVYLYVNGGHVSTAYGSGWGCAVASTSASLAGGWNTISATACDAYACTSASSAVYFVPPAPAISFSPGNGAYVYASPSDVSTSACSSWDAAYVHLYVNGAHVNTGYGGGWGCASTSAAASLGPGWNTVSASACNAWGNCASASASIYFVPPAPAIALYPGNGATVSTSPYGVSTEACSSYGVSYVELYVNGSYVGAGYGIGSGWECVSAWANASLAPGWNTVTASACNGSYNCTSAAVSIYYQPPPPTIAFWTSDGATVYASPYGVGVDACGQPDVSSVDLYVNGAYVGSGYGGGWGCATANVNATLAAGPNTLTAYACTPYACNSASSTLHYIPPAPAIAFSPKSGSTISRNPATVSVEACSPWGVSVVYLYVNNAHVATAHGGECATAAASAYLMVGTNTVSAYACNQYNNCTTSSASLYLLAPPPSFAFSHSEGEHVPSNPVTLWAEACSPDGVSIIYLYLDGAQVAVGYGYGPELGDDPPAQCVSASATVNLTTGWHTVTASACNSSQCDSPSVNIYFPPPVYAVEVAASGPATTIPGYPTGAAGFRVKHSGARTGPMRIDFSATCEGVAVAPCNSVSPAAIEQAYPGDEYFVLVNFNVNPAGTSGRVTLTATPAGGSAQSAVASVEPTPVYKAIVGPVAGEARVDRGSGRQQVVFTVQNKSENAVEPLTFEARVTACNGAVVNCAPVNASIALAREASGTIAVAFDPTGPGAKGVIQLQVLPAGGQLLPGVASYDVEVASVLDVEVRSVNPGTAIDRDACLTIAAGDDAAYECAALRLAHALPTTRTMNKARTPTLIYNSHHAEPTVLVAVNVRYRPTAGSPVPTTLEATLEVQGRAPVSQRFPWVPGCERQWCRLAMRVSDDLATTLYPYSVQVRALNDAGNVASSEPARDTLVVVNRKSSPFGAGWWLAGLEEIRFVGGKILWIGGDGSTRLYTQKNETVWEVEPWVDRRDTISLVAAGVYQRYLPDGARVVFKDGGLHRHTVNRLGHQTDFTYDTVGGRPVLRTIKLPTPAGGFERKYAFEHRATAGGPLLFQVHAPDDEGVPRTTTINPVAVGDLRVSSIVDPNGGEVAFGFVSGARVGWRRNRRGDVTRFGYEADAVFTRVEFDRTRTDGAGAAAYVTTICPAEAQGLLTCAGSLELVDAVRTHLDGPRPDSDVHDKTAFHLDRWGAPRRIVNARGHVTTIERGSPHFPMLVTATVKHNGFRTEAFYNERALLDSTRAIDPLDRKCTDGTCSAVTRYTWHHNVNRVTRVMQPDSTSTEFDYNPANGNLLWQQDGRGPGSRFNYDYYPDGLLRGITQPGGARETVEYDARLGNLGVSRSPRGLETRYDTDLFGRSRVVRTQIERGNLSLWQDDSTTYDVMDRVVRSVSYGPTYKTIPEQSLVVERFPDAEGADTLITRRSVPDTTHIGVISTWFHYDALGRKIAEIAPDSAWEEMKYDEAGNLRELHTRRTDPKTGARLVIRMEYDELNRLKVRRTPPVHYTARRDVGIPKVHQAIVDAEENKPYPRHPNDGEDGYLIGAETATFDYDPLGDGMTVADNGDAQVRRDYYPNGLLRTETQRIRTLDGNDFTTHEYELRYEYDLNGRLKELRHPPKLSPSPSQPLRTAYDYDKVTGTLSTVTDALQNVFTFKFNLRGELESVARPGAIFEVFKYDDDGLIERHTVQNTVSSYYHRNTTFSYDARGKILRSIDAHGPRDDQTAVYSGLGHLVGGAMTSNGWGHVPEVCWNTDAKMERWDDFRYDAFANSWVDVDFTRLTHRCGYFTTASGQTRGYAKRTGRLASTDRWDNDLNYVIQRDVTHYDGAGNSEFATHEWFDRFVFASQVALTDRASYYAADGKVRATDTRTVVRLDQIERPFTSTFEEYRYDALGRRVWMRTRRYCELDPDGSPGDCNLDKVRRTVWDGNHELYEVQMPGGDGSPYLENDVGPVILEMDNTGNGHKPIDPNPYFGRVAYTHALGIDEPLSIIRMGYGDRMDERPVDVGHRALEPFAILPLWSMRGQADLGVFADGAERKCEQRDGTTRCVYIGWPGAWFAYSRPAFQQRTFWHGSMLEDKQDGSGLHYRRNRQYDPATGRFTQEDPIGLAGGMNLYGFANGDPVNFSDPFGLCPMCVVVIGRAAVSVAKGYIEATVLGEEYTWADAGLDALSGAIGAVGAGSSIKLAARAEKGAKKVRTVANGGRFSAEAQRKGEAANRAKHGDKLKCEDCGLDLDANPDKKRLDHRKPWAKGGTGDAENLDYRCETCNSKKSDKWPWP